MTVMIRQETALLLLMSKSLIIANHLSKKLKQCDNSLRKMMVKRNKQCDNSLRKMMVKRNNMADNLCEDVKLKHHHQVFDTLSLLLWLSWSLVPPSGFFAASGLFLFFFNLWFPF